MPTKSMRKQNVNDSDTKHDPDLNLDLSSQLKFLDPVIDARD